MKVDLDKVIEWVRENHLDYWHNIGVDDYWDDDDNQFEVDIRKYFQSREFANACHSKMSGVHGYR